MGSRLFFAASVSLPRSFARALRFCQRRDREKYGVGLVTDTALHRAKHRLLIWNLINPSFSQRQRHMRRCPNKDHDSTQYSGEKNSHDRAE